MKRLTPFLLLLFCGVFPMNELFIQTAYGESPEASSDITGEVREASSDIVIPEQNLHRIYLDVSLTGPPNAGEVWYAARQSANAEGKIPDLIGQMRLCDPVTQGQNIWSACYTADLPEGYDEILFAFYEPDDANDIQEAGKNTDLLDIPDSLKTPCFYLDADDPSVYDGETRGGYWDEAFRIRNPETEYSVREAEDPDGDEGDGLVKVPEGSMPRESEILYLSSDLYDYYTDSELNGLSRGSCGENEASQRMWVPFRNLDEALSDRYRENGGIPLYVGHFQPDVFEGTRFSEIAPLLNLTGWENQNGFFSTNNSTLDVLGNGSAENRKYNCAAQGLVGTSLKNGFPVCAPLAGSGESEDILPLFSEEFLEGKNNRNTKLGKVYHNAAFPFRQVDRDGDGILYWSFDSAEDHVHLLKNDNSADSGFEWYFANPQEDPEDDFGWSKNVNSSGTANGDPISDEYGFFPLNDPDADTDGSAYNFGFGMRLAFDFTLPEGGMLRDKDGNEKPVIFTFSGDDDLWVFLDGNLVLDVGGDHGKVEGTINFADQISYVSNVKKSQGNPDAAEGPRTDSFTLEEAESGKHQLVLFYMERGMWESNLKLQFNMAPERAEEPEEIEVPFTGGKGIPEPCLMAGFFSILIFGTYGFLEKTAKERR